MTAPSAARPERPRRGWTVLTGLLVALTVAIGMIAVPWFLLQDRPGSSAAAGPRWFGGYVDVTAGGGTAAMASTTAADAVVLAFVASASQDACLPSWGGVYSLAEAAQALDLDGRISRMRQHGRPVAVSFGGAGNIELAGSCGSVGALAGAYATVLDRYAVTTMDLDLGTRSLDDPVAGERRAQAVAQLQANHRARGARLAVWLTLPAGRGGLGTDGLRSIRQMLQAGVDLSGVNALTAGDDASVHGASMGADAVTALTAVHDQLGRLYDDLNVSLPADDAWTIMGATPTIGRTAEHGPVFALNDAATVNAFAREHGLARLSMWSANRDRACAAGAPAADAAAGSCSGIPQQDEAFADVLGRGWGNGVADSGIPSPPVSSSAPPASTPVPSPDP
ncbi:chitinase family 18 [Microbacterium azadirachtae]|uniref:Chitinase family 18 n=1 Tax=Microbacterium azadirachtae TaxID=582680 RepID=A0A1I6GUF1_9MICO|nr:hypothetical protein [Microbacterium azadirachtae]SFR45864.1 chitinase family 18 [Microbacterium azadirachtae]